MVETVFGHDDRTLIKWENWLCYVDSDGRVMVKYRVRCLRLPDGVPVPPPEEYQEGENAKKAFYAIDAPGETILIPWQTLGLKAPITRLWELIAAVCTGRVPPCTEGMVIQELP